MGKTKRTGKKVSKSAQFRKYTLHVLVGGLIVSSLISIIAILIGEFSDTVRRALFTTVLMVVHALVALAFVSVEPGRDKFTSALITNVSFAIVVASFFSAVLGTWAIISSDTVREFYTTYVLAFLATLAASAILQLRHERPRTRALAFASTGTLVLLYVLVQPWIFAGSEHLPDIYFRSIGATAVLFVTLIVLTTISYRLYAAKHRVTSHRKPMTISAWGWTAIIILFFLFGWPLLERLIVALSGM